MDELLVKKILELLKNRELNRELLEKLKQLSYQK